MSLEKKNTPKKSSVLAQWRKRKKAAGAVQKITPRPSEAKVSPTSGQQRLWLLQQLYPDNPFYQYAHLYKVKGKLDVALLTDCFQKLFDQHEILRTNFVENAQDVELLIHPQLDFSIEKIGLHLDQGDDVEAAANAAIHDFATKTFDLTQDPLLKIGLIKISEEYHWMVLSIHHIIGDRSSLLIFQQQLFSLYQQGQKNEILTAPNELPIQYTDYAFWKNKQTTSEDSLQYWLDQLGGELPLLELPTDKVRPKRATFGGAIIAKKITPQLSRQVRAFAKEQDTTLYVVFLATFKILLARYANQKDILVGSPFSNRDRMELEQLIGFFNETLVLRSQVDGEMSFHDFIQKIKSTTMEALAHKNVPFDNLVKKLNPERFGSANPIFQTMFVYNNSSTSNVDQTGLEIEEESIDLQVSKFDLTLFVTNHGDQGALEISLEYALDLFEEETAQRMLAHLEVLLDSAMNQPSTPLSRLAIMDSKERQRILYDWNDTTTPLPEETAIHRLIEKMAATYPDRKAVVADGQSISYSELHEQANKIANKLLRLSLPPSTPVGLYANRSLEMMIGILGILRAGAAYVPLDPEYPKERIDFILKDAQAAVVFCQKQLRPQLTTVETEILVIEDIIAGEGSVDLVMPEVSNNDLAYIIYTSGSTGQPKGVPITHQNLVHSTTARFSFFEHQPDAFLLLSSFSFDSSIVGIFWPLCSGGTLVLPPRRIEQNIQTLAQVIQKNNITHTLLLPSLYHLLLEYAEPQYLQSLRTIMVAGEACPASLVLKHYKKLPNVNLVNEYGPTEGTVWSTAHRISPTDAFGTVPIGRPIPNMDNYILDKNLQPVPVGVTGELYIGGRGIARGYWNRPTLTDERFLPSPFDLSKSAKIYKTGDLAKFRKDGVIDFLGRADQQVKIRGHRIEVEEIQIALEKIKAIKAALVVVQDNEMHRRLVAYFTSDTPVEVSSIRETLNAIFPKHMIPSALVPLENFPTLPNGKIDFKKLPAPDQRDLEEQNFVAPTSETEKTLASIWEEVLKINPIGVHDNFFEIGGDSIQSIRIIAKAQKAGIELAPNQLFEHQTIYQLAHFLNQKANDDEDGSNWSAIVPLNKKGSKPALFCIHSGGGHVFFYHPLAQHLSPEQPLYALQPSGLDGKATLHSSIEAMAADYIQEMKKVQPEGPYHILGTCFSNAVGLEMANQLQSAGETVALLIFVDSGPQYLLGAEERGGKQPVTRFVKMIKAGNWKGIQKKFRNRFIRTKQKALAPLENEQERHLRLTIQNLNQLYHHYSWKPFDGKITLIRSSEFAQRKDKDIHITQWQKLAKGGLEVHTTEGHHTSLFMEPEVQGLAEKIKACVAVIE
ncbi:MAG: amino acid adenylation domain-containing protein [Bacteroidota bacterium]